MRDAARLLLVEREALKPVLESAPAPAFELDTVCTGWSVRDVLAHCASAMHRTASGTVTGFTPEANQVDVDVRRAWELDEVLAELWAGYEPAARTIDEGGGRLDGLGLGEWIHGGDVREALGAADPYASAGIDLALGLLIERSAMRSPAVTAEVDGDTFVFGSGEPVGRLRTDVETFVRLCGGRRPDPGRYELTGLTAAEVVLFA
jgi:uncharacterized protein (TIGR03083 family)